MIDSHNLEWDLYEKSVTTLSHPALMALRRRLAKTLVPEKTAQLVGAAGFEPAT
ncbi:MAG: hypothetical protein FWC84_05990 [Alphaproteobacteria bacterium]|nr:hypothetical protein [Alphaproteobacteria bacterium]